MPQSIAQTTCLKKAMIQMPTARFFFLVIFTSFAISLIWIQLVTIPEQQSANESLVQEALKNAARDSRYSEVYRKPSRLPKALKYILLWTEQEFAPFYYFGKGQREFIKNNCSEINCYVTDDRKFFGGDLTKFVAIAFNGRNMKHNVLPKHRSPHQKYIFFNMESADNYPVCSENFDGFFNWTSTYRLDSDIPIPYILIRNNSGEVIGPKSDMRWMEDFSEVDEKVFHPSQEFADKLMNKSKAAAWFVSHCPSRSGRKKLARKLQKALAPYGYSLDVYGTCGPLKCPKDKKNECDFLLERDYYFYLSFENSLAVDYVTEKLLTALQHDVVPVVYGGADYSRFLPPGSYLDARKFNVYDLAAIMDRLMNAPKVYQQYFRWKNQYTYSDPKHTEDVCAICAALNDKERMEKFSVYDNFREWWYPEYRNRC